MAVPPPFEGPIAGHPDKPALRKWLRAQRAAWAEARGDDGRHDDARAATALLLPHLPAGAIVALYLAFRDEFATDPMIEALAAQGHALALPALLDDVTMVFRAWAPGDPLERGPFRLRQPAAGASERAPRIVICPLVGFNRDGGRIGQGASHFDRAFVRYPGARRIGLAWSMQEVAALPRDPWDVPLHAVVTEKDYIVMPDASS